MAYNLTVKGENVRIGNWFEEIRLKQDTGIRFYPSPKDNAGKLLTQSRCITHTEQTLPKDYASNLRDTIKDPKLHPDYTAKRATVGPRAMRLETQLKNDINEEFKNRETSDFVETRKVNYATTSKSTFRKEDFQPTLKENDPNLRIPTKAANYSTEPAITYYSHAVTNSDAKLSFPATFVGSTNPFKKSNAFSADVRNEILARRSECNERPKPLPTLTEFRVLNKLRNQLMASAQNVVGGARQGHTNGRSIRHIIDTVWNAQTDPEVVSYDVFQGILSDVYGITISKEDRNAILSAFDSRTDNNVSLAEFTNLIRRTPSPRRLQLIDAYYTSLDPAGTGIDYSAIKASVLSSNQNLQEVVNTLNWGPESKGMNPKVSVDDFFDFYIDLSAEVAENEELFEEVLANTWSR